MSSSRLVPETRVMKREALSPDRAFRALRRRQPGLSWLLPGAGVAIALWWLASLLLAAYVRCSGAFGATYGPLTAVMALLLWANLTGVALFLGLSFAAQMEARRVGVPEPAEPDRWKSAPTAA